MDGDDNDCSMDAGSLLTVVVVNGGGNGIKPMELISIDEGSGKDVIAAAAINRCCSQQWLPLLPLMMNNDCGLLAVIVINCVAAGSGDDGHQWRG